MHRANPVAALFERPSPARGPIARWTVVGGRHEQRRSFNRGQNRQIRLYRRGAERLRRAADELEAGSPSAASRRVIDRVTRVIGFPNPTPAQLRDLAQTFERSLVPLEGSSADGYTAYIADDFDDFRRRTQSIDPSFRPSEGTFMATPRGGRVTFVNPAHPGLGDEDVFSWAIGHEAPHAGPNAYDDALGPGPERATAYRHAGTRQRAAYAWLRDNAPDRAARNPDHIVELSRSLTLGVGVP